MPNDVINDQENYSSQSLMSPVVSSYIIVKLCIAKHLLYATLHAPWCKLPIYTYFSLRAALILELHGNMSIIHQPHSSNGSQILTTFCTSLSLNNAQNLGHHRRSGFEFSHPKNFQSFVLNRCVFWAKINLWPLVRQRNFKYCQMICAINIPYRKTQQ